MGNKRILIIIALFILSLFGISFYGGAVSYGFFFTVLLIPVFCGIYIFYVIQSLKIFQKTDGRDMVSGTPADFYITLQNEGWISFSSLRIVLYSSFSSISGLSDGAEYELPPHSSIKLKTLLLCRYRGEYDVGVKEIVVRDFLGLFTVHYRIKEPLSVIVVPRILHLSEPGGNKALPDADRDSILNRTEPDIPVRDYYEGDDIRFINWRVTAAAQKLMVREKKGEEKSGIAIVMDPGRYYEEKEDYLPPEDEVTGHVLALSLYYMEHAIPVDAVLLTDRAERIPVMDVAGFDSLYGVISRYSFRKDRDLTSLTRELLENGVMTGYSMLIFILQKWSDREYECIRSLNTAHVPVRVYLSSNDNGSAPGAGDGRIELIVSGREKKEEAS